MGLTVLNLSTPLDPPPQAPPSPDPCQLMFSGLGRCIPGAGLLYSALVHEGVAFVLIGMSYISGLGIPFQAPQLTTMQVMDLSHATPLTYLPAWGEAAGSAIAAPDRTAAAGNFASHHGNRRFAFPGPQRIVSVLPRPTSDVQTVLQGEVGKLRVLPFTPMPNIILAAGSRASEAPPREAIAELSVPRPPPPTDTPAKPPVQTDLQNLVALSPMPGPAHQLQELPVGEARGRFAISPDTGFVPQVSEAAAPGAAVGPHSVSLLPSAALPAGIPGLRIQGGTLERRGGEARASAAIAPQTSYGMTIISTPGSGGGLPDLGVFSQRRVYTVYVDMRSLAGAASPSWILQYALAASYSQAAQAPAATQPSQTGLVPPFPLEKEKQLPAFPPELVRRYAHAQVIVHALIDAAGRMHDLSVKQSPDPRLNAPALAALSGWSFRPGELNGSPVEVEVLLGIPLFSE